MPQVLLRSAFLKDLLTPAKIFSLVTQKDEPNIIEIVDAVEKPDEDYKKLLKKFQRDQNSVFELPLLKAVVTEVEGNDEEKGSHMSRSKTPQLFEGNNI